MSDNTTTPGSDVHSIDLPTPPKDRIIQCSLGLIAVQFGGAIAVGYALGTTANRTITLGLLGALTALLIGLLLNIVILVNAFDIDEN